MVNFLQLQIFVAVIEQGSFSAAAEELKLTQPGVSQHIRTLEETYKVRLFNRNGPHIELTEAGQHLLEVARPLVQQARHFEETFEASLGKVGGRLNLVYTKNSVAGLYQLPGLLAQFHQRYNGVRFGLQQASEETALQKLLEREIQFVLLHNLPRHKALESLLLHSEELVLVLPPAHRWHDRSIEIGELKGQPFLLRTTGSETRRLAEGVLRVAGLNFNDLNVVAEVDSVEGLILLAQAGLGLGFASAAVVHHYAELGKVGCARLHLTKKDQTLALDLKRQVYLTRLTGSTEAERVSLQERFWDFARTYLQPSSGDSLA